jgi:hypothetical protein
MSYISDKIAEVRAAGHVVPEGIEELFLAIEDEIGLDSKQKKDEPEAEVKQPQAPEDGEPASDANPLDGERLES